MTIALGSIRPAAAVEMPASKASDAVGKSDALKPAATEQNATIKPTTGERPAALKASAPSGMSTTYMASAAMEPVMPVSASTKVSHLGPTRETEPRNAAESIPDSSATATPKRITTTRPSGGNSTKLMTASETIWRKPSGESRLVTWMVSSVAGLTALNPMVPRTQLSTSTTPARMKNNQNGSGSLLPTHSIQLSTLRSAPSPFFCFLRVSAGCDEEDMARPVS